MTDQPSVADRLAVVRNRIAAAGGDRSRVRIVAVTKGFGPEAARDALALGLTDLGESYAQELVAKASTLAADVPTGGPSPRWHFIGRLQSNKVRHLASVVDCWQSVDRGSLIEAIARHSPGAHVLIQVNVSGESQKGGCAPEDGARLVDLASEQGLVVDGLMAVGRTGPAAEARAGFALLRDLADRLGLAECSMGMSHDLEVAVAEGATMVRIGEGLFGPRPLSPGRVRAAPGPAN